jgi:hypothetical protein
MLKVKDFDQSFYVLAPENFTPETPPLELRDWVEVRRSRSSCFL